MNPVYDFWKKEYSMDRPLETDSWLSRTINRYVVAGMMNTFPKTTTKALSFSRGELARLLFVEKEGGSYRSLRAMYEYEDPRKRGDLINRLLMQSPAVKAARNRRVIAQQILQRSLEAQPPDAAVLVMTVGGGDGRLEAEVLARMKRRDIYYCGVDKDKRAVEENRATFLEYGLEERGFVHVSNIAEISDPLEVLQSAERRFGIRFDGAHIAVCHGIAEYLDIGVDTNHALSQMLAAVYDCVRTEGRLIISHTDYHDRVRWLERGLSWYMRLRDMEELANEVEKAGWQISICEHEPMGLITMCLAVKSVDEYLRIDSPSQLRRPRMQRPAVAAAR
ncbi:MAG: class I SAM-dependent methyltransferase family protein [Pirellulales bacterium]|nr:class I SAM-dependent methyltransferase family protein [Pirellulales bacterium]